MSNGGGKTGRQLEQPGTWRRRKVGGGDDYARAIAKIAVAQVCEGEGFQAFQQSALEALSDVVVRYILNVGKSAHCHANLSGRTECHAFDVIQGLAIKEVTMDFLSCLSLFNQSFFFFS